MIPKQQSPFITASLKSPYFYLQMTQNSSLVLTRPRVSHFILNLYVAAVRVHGDFWNCVEKLHSAHKHLLFLHQPKRLMLAFTDECWSNFTVQPCKISQVLWIAMLQLAFVEPKNNQSIVITNEWVIFKNWHGCDSQNIEKFSILHNTEIKQLYSFGRSPYRFF